MTKTHTGTIAEALARSIAELQRLVAIADVNSGVGLALVTIKRNLQKIKQGVPVGRRDWLSVAAALQEVEKEIAS